jgi:DNA-binding transcriptional ArsR family regulator
MPKASPKKNDAVVEGPGRFAYEGLQRAFHEKARLGIMTSLMLHPEGLTFTDLKELCGLSDGNLNRHLEVLTEADFVSIVREGSGRSSKSTCTITSLGHRSFTAYLTELQQVIQDATSRQATTLPQSARAGLPQAS